MASKLTICMVSDDFLPAATGVGTHIKLLAPALVAAGYRVHVITTRRSNEPETEVWQGVYLHRVFTVPAYGFYQALPSGRTIRRILDQVAPDVVHHHYVGYMMGRVCGIARFRRIPQVSTYHFSSEVLPQPLLMRPFAPLVRRLLINYNNKFDLVIAPSRKLVDQIVSEGVRTPVRYITNPVVFEGGAAAKPAERGHGFTILYAGRLGQEKNIGYLLKAFAGVLVSLPDAVVWIAGQGPELDTLRRICRDLRIVDKVHFLGFLDHQTLATYYAACDVFVLPSLVETQGLVAMEAMRFARPVIVTKAIVSAHELVEDGISGYVVDPASVQDLTDRLVRLGHEPTMRRSMGDAGYLRAEAYRPELVVAETAIAYADAITACRRGSLG
jgi:glycosyltransferase involved in cell wall biosynthesis